MTVRLRISLLGPFQVTLDGQAVTTFRSNNARALLAYLAVEADQSHSRETLAGLLWSERPDRVARNNLRATLANLRTAIGDRQAHPPYLLITRQTVQFNPASDHWLDVAAFIELLGATHLSSAPHLERSSLSSLQQAVSLYRDSFLHEFAIEDSPAFEVWTLSKQEQCERLLLVALQHLATLHEHRGEYELAQDCALRQLELEPWREEAHRQLMRALARSGQRNAALTQYEVCRRLLAQELGVAPVPETTALYERIRSGVLGRGSSISSGTAGRPGSSGEVFSSAPLHIHLPAPQSFISSVSPFVGRERELAQLERFLQIALAGQGRVVFVTGEAGSGKTALVAAFARQATATHDDVVVAGGNCNEYLGLGDPYLPFRESLQLLVGDMEGKRAERILTSEHARRLWALSPITVQALVAEGPDLIDRFVPGATLTARAEMLAPEWRSRLEVVLQRRARAGPQAPGPGASAAVPTTMPQPALFEQVTRVLHTIARQQPLILALDDLQWIDDGSASLLFHLGRRLAGSRILVVGAYRPTAVALDSPSASPPRQSLSRAPSRGSGQAGPAGWVCHPLAPIVYEFQREWGAIQVDLDQAAGRPFVDALLDSTPNRLGSAFRDTLTRHTGGHALFTVELLQGLRERGNLERDEVGQWVEGPILDWETLPMQVEAVIAERLSRLPPDWQEMLAVASVEGETFTAEVVARVQGLDERVIIQCLSGPLGQQHGLVRAVSLQRLGTTGAQRLSRYCFRHHLFYKYLYDRLDPVQRAHWHEAVGNTLETVYQEHDAALPAIAALPPELARHFEVAGIVPKAVRYLLLAARRAYQLSASEESVALCQRGLALLETQPDSPARAGQELALQLALGAALLATRGWGAPERLRACARAYELVQAPGMPCESYVPTQFLSVLAALSESSRAQGEFQKSLDWGEQLLSLVRQAQDPIHVVTAHWTLGISHLLRGDLILARERLEQALAGYDPQYHRSLKLLVGVNIEVSCQQWMSYALWTLGYPDQALARSQEALALAQDLDHTPTLIRALSVAGVTFRLLRREVLAVREHMEELCRLVSEKNLPELRAAIALYQGYEQVMATAGAEGPVEEADPELVERGLAQMRRGLAALQAMGVVGVRPHQLLLLADACLQARRAEEGLRVLDEAQALVAQMGSACVEAETHRLRGELILLGDEAVGAGWPIRADRPGPPALMDEAEACFWQAIEVARRQQAKSWELRAALSLGRLWQRQGRREEARAMLFEIYGWFTEGFETPDLQDARELLEKLAPEHDSSPHSVAKWEVDAPSRFMFGA